MNKLSQLAHSFNSDLFFSCHKCASDYIPFYHVSMDTTDVDYLDF